MMVVTTRNVEKMRLLYQSKYIYIYIVRKALFPAMCSMEAKRTTQQKCIQTHKNKAIKTDNQHFRVFGADLK